MNIRMLNPDTKFRSGDGRPVAVIGLTPDALAERYGIEFVRGADDFDYYQTAVIALPNGPITRLLRYAHDPDPGTAVYADVQLDIGQAQRTVSNLLGLTRNDFKWLAEHTEAHAGAYVTERMVNRAAVDQDIEIPLQEQEVVTSKQAVVTGSVGDFTTETQRVVDTVRREEVHVEGMSNPRIHTGGFSAQQRMRYSEMSEMDRARYERFTERERAQYDAMTPEQQQTWAAEYDRRNPGSGVSETFRDRDHTRR